MAAHQNARDLKQDSFVFTVLDSQISADGQLLDPSTIPDSTTTASSLVYPTKGIIGGETVAQWTEQWWQWAVNTPSSTSPFTDTTGAFADVNNSGSVFFVAGLAGSGGTVSRAFDVPAGTPLLIPLINIIDVLDKPGATNQLLANKNFTFEPGGWQTSVSGLFLKIDGQAIANLQSSLVRTNFFTLGPIQAGSSGADVFGFPPGGFGNTNYTG